MTQREQFEAQAFPHLDALYRTALRMAGDAVTAEDVVQETFLRAWKNYGSFQQGTNFKAWIFTILTHTFINEYRRRGRGPLITDFVDHDPAEDAEPMRLTSEDIRGLADQLGDEAAKALAQVPAPLRIIFLLSTFERLSYKEIAEVVGVPIGTVMSRLFRAREILRRELAQFARRPS